MATLKISQLPTVANALLTDIVPVVQGGVTVSETLLQVSQLITQQVILHYAGNPNGHVSGQTYQLLWDTLNGILFIATTTGTATSTIWTIVASGSGSGTPIGPAGGDLGSTYPNPIVLKLNTVPLGIVTPTAGNLLIGSGTSWSSNAVSGDATLSGTGALTLLSVNANNGTFGDVSLIPQFSVDTKGRITGVSNLSVSGAQLVGTTTNDNASAGHVGEYISSSVLVGSSISITSATPTNITSISLTAGDWDVSASVYFNTATSTVVNNQYGYINNVSATAPTAAASNNVAGAQYQTALTGISNNLMIGPVRISINTTTIIYVGVLSTFTTSTTTAYGFIGARRIR
jgi:hypothetical protein